VKAPDFFSAEEGATGAVVDCTRRQRGAAEAIRKLSLKGRILLCGAGVSRAVEVEA
jgi:hypothetical protein